MADKIARRMSVGARRMDTGEYYAERQRERETE